MGLVFGIRIHPAQTVLAFGCGTRMMNPYSKDILAVGVDGNNKVKQVAHTNSFEVHFIFSANPGHPARHLKFPILSFPGSGYARARENVFFVSDILKQRKV